ncbi:fibrobacter succinogenes major paralogous domain-containing protein [Candidatus Saccharibacteria bacterium]|nr:fibrobacter succinogenes major paralogous domain-containing protein [Candidatus Saccharibacteria bacterium]
MSFFIPSSVAIYLYDEDMVESSDFTTNVVPRAEGSVSSLETNVRVTAAGIYGYNLSINSATANMVGQNMGSNTLVPSGGGIDNPIPFSSGNCNAWGFATPGIGGNHSQAFDPSYSTLYNISTSILSSNYAAVPTSPTLIDTVDNNDPGNVDETRPYYFAFCAGGSTNPDTYSATVTWTAVGISMPTEPPALPLAQNGDTMQEVGVSLSCPETRTWVVDARDNRTYWIRKIPGTASGGNGDLCWMETNLAYGGGGNWDSSLGWPDDRKTLTVLTSGTGAWDNTLPRVFTNVVPSTGSGLFTANPTPPRTGTGAATGANGAQYGYSYSWCAAMGGPTVNLAACNQTETNPANIDITASVCPAGWRLPTGEVGAGEFTALNNALNGGSLTDATGLLDNWLGVYSGTYNIGMAGVGNIGYWWSSTLVDATTTRFLIIESTNANTNPSNIGPKIRGFAVRCVR